MALYMLVCVLAASCARALVEVLVEAVDFVLEALFTVVFYGARWSWRGLRYLGVGLGNSGLIVVIIVDLLLQDWGWKERRAVEFDEDEQVWDQGDEGASESLFEAARAVLGLPQIFTKAELKAAFHAAMKSAHPDGDGTVEAAQEVNEANEIIKLEMGWS
jgi:hypothetical protein